MIFLFIAFRGIMWSGLLQLRSIATILRQEQVTSFRWVSNSNQSFVCKNEGNRLMSLICDCVLCFHMNKFCIASMWSEPADLHLTSLFTHVLWWKHAHDIHPTGAHFCYIWHCTLLLANMSSFLLSLIWPLDFFVNIRLMLWHPSVPRYSYPEPFCLLWLVWFHKSGNGNGHERYLTLKCQIYVYIC